MDGGATMPQVAGSVPDGAGRGLTAHPHKWRRSWPSRRSMPRCGLL